MKLSFHKLPVFLQNEKADCGPTCLRMILSYYKKKISQEVINTKFKISSEGVSVQEISEVAQQYGLETLSVRLAFQQLELNGRFPCIAHFHGNHFVVIERVEKGIAHVADPAKGTIKLNRIEFEKRWLPKHGQDGVILFMSPTEDFQRQLKTKESTVFGLSFFATHLKKNWKDLLKLAAFLAVGSLIQLMLPLITQAVVDQGIEKKDISLLYLLIFAQAALTFGRVTVEMGRSWFLQHVSNRINVQIITEFLQSLIRAPISFFDQRSVGDILRRIEDNSRLERFLSSTLFSILFAAVSLIVYSVLLASYQLSIMIVFFAGSIAYSIFILQFMKKRKKLDYLQFGEYSKNESGIVELVEGIRDIKLNQSEKRMVDRWRNLRYNIFKISLSFSRLHQWQMGGATLINETRNAVITFLAAQSVINEEMTFGMMLAMQYIIGQLHSPVNEFVNFTHQYQEAKISFERINAVSEIEREESVVESAKAKPTYLSTISFMNVDFSYGSSNAKIVLRNLSFSIPIGKCIAIVGESGSGKTTLLNLLLKLHKPVSGKILIDGIDLDEINLDAWRCLCGTVLQNGYIFSDTIEKNIAMSGEGIDEDMLNRAINLANLKSVLEDIPNGVKAKVGAEGHGLSAGQRQRILIARAIYKNPQILLFDEATSSLDTSNEKIITNNISQHFRGKTVIIIAHRLSTVVDADKILVLSKGELVEQGTHSELITKRGYYFDLIKNQLELNRSDNPMLKID